MGMYGALIIDPKDKPVLQPAKEYVMVMSEFNDKKIQEYPITLETDYYLINGYKNQYHKYYPLAINTYDTIRLYIINIGTTIPYPFHLHSTTFKAYPSGLLDNEPIHVQTIPVAPGDAVIVEAKWKYPGTYLFHSHGIQEERGNMGNITVTDGGNNKDSTSNLSTSNTITTMIGKTTPLSKSVSMFEWQYEKQKELQKPVAINYREQEPIVINDTEDIVINDTQQKPIVINYTQEEHNEEKDNTSNTSTSAAISIVPGSSNPNNPKFYDPSPANVTVGTTVTWTNNDSALHTVTSGNSTSGPSGVFDSSIMPVGRTFQHTFDKAGTFDYYCILHPFMIAQVVVK
jgi:plastocyanin